MYTTSPLVIVDLDDVLSSTTKAACIWHNKHFGTQLQLEDFHCNYHWWKNPGWGPPEQTTTKANSFYKSEEFRTVQPTAGAKDVLQKLKDEGFRFAVLTSREQELAELTESWLEKWYSGIFEKVYFSQDFTKPRAQDTASGPVRSEESRGAPYSNSWLKLSKAEVSKFKYCWDMNINDHKIKQMCKNLQAKLFIDDALENVWDCLAAEIPALLFGDYDWGKRLSLAEDSKDLLSFEEREAFERNQGYNTAWWIRDNVEIPSKSIWRVKDWQQVSEWIEGPGKHHL